MDTAPPGGPAFASQVNASPEGASLPGEQPAGALHSSAERHPAFLAEPPALAGARGCPCGVRPPPLRLPRPGRYPPQREGTGGDAPALLETHLWGASAWAGSVLCKGWRGAGPAPRRG